MRFSGGVKRENEEQTDDIINKYKCFFFSFLMHLQIS